jgi:hypothetical protein
MEATETTKEAPRRPEWLDLAREIDEHLAGLRGYLYLLGELEFRDTTPTDNTWFEIMEAGRILLGNVQNHADRLNEMPDADGMWLVDQFRDMGITRRDGMAKAMETLRETLEKKARRG